MQMTFLGAAGTVTGSKYLLQSALSVEDIARKLGFTESRSFIRYFKGCSGMTPGEFRQAQQGG